MKNSLVRCPDCKRHVYASEPACPFCARQTNASPAVLAAALTAGLALTGCGSEAAQNRPPVEVAPEPAPSPTPKEIATSDPSPSPNPREVAPLYGAPAPVDVPVAPPAAAYGAPAPIAPSPTPRR